MLDTQFDWAMIVNEGICFDAVCFDFKSAFESVTYIKLLRSLPRLGVGTKLVTWIAAHPRNRTFRVRVNNKHSDFVRLTSGCPQGTLLGPLMHILYTSPLVHVLGLRAVGKDEGVCR